MDKLQQERYENSLQLVGLPESQSDTEDIKQVIKLSKEKLGIKLKSSDLQEVTRLGKKNRSKPRNLTLKFRDKSVRNNMYERQKKTMTNSDPSKNILYKR